MPSLYAAFSLPEVNRSTVLVCQNLNFDVLGAGEKAFDVDSTVAKGSHGFSPSSCSGLVKIGRIMHGSHAFSAPSAGRFEQKRVTHPS
tara:strand:+ start:447 stop:710 length:264 start_codon:yes stop_codon:yes gene_type:complete